MIATYFNALTVIIGTLIGLVVKNRINESYRQLVFTSSGLVTLVIGISMALGTNSFLILLFSLIIGGAAGYALKIEDRIMALGAWMERRLSGGKGTDESARNFALGFFNASLLFCSGAMTVVGSIQAGTVGDYQLIMIKAIMDGAMAIIFTAAYGIGVMASALFILVYQGSSPSPAVSLPRSSGRVASTSLRRSGMLLLMIGFNLLDIRQTKAGNFLPAMIVAPLLAMARPLFTRLLGAVGL